MAINEAGRVFLFDIPFPPYSTDDYDAGVPTDFREDFFTRQVQFKDISERIINAPRFDAWSEISPSDFVKDYIIQQILYRITNKQVLAILVGAYSSFTGISNPHILSGEEANEYYRTQESDIFIKFFSPDQTQNFLLGPCLKSAIQTVHPSTPIQKTNMSIYALKPLPDRRDYYRYKAMKGWNDDALAKQEQVRQMSPEFKDVYFMLGWYSINAEKRSPLVLPKNAVKRMSFVYKGSKKRKPDHLDEY